jgi:predicted RNase H-like HicB family nuclease
MKYPVAWMRTEEGYSVSCPGLPGCWSQGATEEEALANIRDAIHDYLEVAKELAGERNLREVEVPAQRVPKIPGIPHFRAVRALEKAGFVIARQGIQWGESSATPA